MQELETFPIACKFYRRSRMYMLEFCLVFHRTIVPLYQAMVVWGDTFQD